MASFSSDHHLHHHPFPLETNSFCSTSNSLKLGTPSERPLEEVYNFSQFHYQNASFQQNLTDANFNESISCLEQVIKPALSNNEPSVTTKHSNDSYPVAGNCETGEQVIQTSPAMATKRYLRNDSSQTKAKEKKQKKCNVATISRDGEKKKTRVAKKEQKKVPQEAPIGYIHVRARRGQATDSHSLAERVRREKISERMKLLQSLVPGCDKVCGKAHMLDEIINYVQSLQNQVEFLSMKLASINPMLYDFGMDLEPLMPTTDQNFQNCSNPKPTVFSNATNNFTISNNYPLLETSSSQMFQQLGQMVPLTPPQSEGQMICDVNGQVHKFISPLDLSNSLCSFQ